MFRPLRGLPALALGLLLACGATAPPPTRAAVPIQHDTSPGLPAAATETLAYVRAHHAAPPGFEGGRRFGNYEHRLPERDAGGRHIAYQEWDVHPHQEHRNRGAERLITGSDGRAWFTADHYGHFVEVGRTP